jgi:hypothetical protein
MVSGKNKQSSGGSERTKAPNNARIPSGKSRFRFGKYRPDGVDLNTDGSWKKD